ncbi:MAG: alanine racemase [Candidatus Saccharimonadales bacterium]
MSLRHHVNRLLSSFERHYETYNLIEVSRSALLHNFDHFAKQTGLQVVPVLKANAYGHGIDLVARALKSRYMPYIAVDGYFEGLRVREISSQPVLVMGAILPANFKYLQLKNFTYVINNLACIDALGRRRAPVKIHLEINSGMNRYGVDPEQIPEFIDRIKNYSNIQLEGVMSHLADADGLDPHTVTAAVDIFDQAVDAVLSSGLNPTMFHVAQSAGSLKARSRHATAIRLGLALYGINPLDPADPHYAELSNLKPSLCLTSTIAQTHDLKAGDKVSYNYTFTAPKAMRIGVLPLGYYEGVPRTLSNTGTVTINGEPVPIVGRVCMNHTIVSLEGTSAQIGDQVVVLSNDPSAVNSVSSIAARHDLFSYAHLTSLSPDLRRRLVD